MACLRENRIVIFIFKSSTYAMLVQPHTGKIFIEEGNTLIFRQLDAYHATKGQHMTNNMQSQSQNRSTRPAGHLNSTSTVRKEEKRKDHRKSQATQKGKPS
jgi:hypothetical protein